MLSEEKEVLEYIREAFSLRSQELYKPAIEMLYKALAMDNDNIEVLFQLGEVYFLMKNYDRATKYLEQVLAQSPKHLESLKLLQKMCLEEEYFSEALTFSEQIFKIEKISENFKNLIINYSKLNQINKLIKHENNELNTPETVYEIANAYYKNGKVKKALDLLNKYPHEENLKLLIGRIYFETNELEKAKEIFDTIPTTTENAQVLNYKGLYALEEMNFIDAIKYFSKATSISKHNPIYFYNLGNAYFFNGWMKEAKQAYSKAIYLAPDNMDYRYSLSYLYYETEQYDNCKKEADAILSTCPTHTATRTLKALLLNRENEYSKAKEVLEKNIQDGAKDDFTLVSLGKTYALLDMYSKAEKVIKEVIEKNPKNLNYISDLADIYIKEKLYDKALDLAQKTVKLNPNYIYGYVLTAKIAELKGDFDLMKEYSQEALSLDMNCSEAYYTLAKVRKNEKDFEEAIECMKRAIIHDLTNPKYYAEMSELYKEIKDYKTALDYISEAESMSNSTEYKYMYSELVKINRKK